MKLCAALGWVTIWVTSAGIQNTFCMCHQTQTGLQMATSDPKCGWSFVLCDPKAVGTGALGQISGFQRLDATRVYLGAGGSCLLGVWLSKEVDLEAKCLDSRFGGVKAPEVNTVESSLLGHKTGLMHGRRGSGQGLALPLWLSCCAIMDSSQASLCLPSHL